MMKKMKGVYILLICTMISIGACAQKSKNETAYNKSLETWKKLKKEKGNSYTYEVHFQSWVGFGSTTTITVKEGKVVERKYESFENNDEKKSSNERFVEKNSQIGSHKTGAAALTMDDIYIKAKKDYLHIDTTQNYVFFSLDEQGILKMCGYVDKNCADDCYNGIRIQKFTWIKD